MDFRRCFHEWNWTTEAGCDGKGGEIFVFFLAAKFQCVLNGKGAITRAAVVGLLEAIRARATMTKGLAGGLFGPENPPPNRRLAARIYFKGKNFLTQTDSKTEDKTTPNFRPGSRKCRGKVLKIGTDAKSRPFRYAIPSLREHRKNMQAVLRLMVTADPGVISLVANGGSLR